MTNCRNLILSWAGAVALLSSVQAGAVEPDSPWTEIVAEAKGQSVYFNAWGGSERINSYLAWVGKRLSEDY